MAPIFQLCEKLQDCKMPTQLPVEAATHINCVVSEEEIKNEI